jgi:formate--tetrahydrofolate ligase
MQPILDVAAELDIDEKYVDLYGKYKAKIDYNLLNDLKDKQNGKLVLVTAITPTPTRQGKTITAVDLADGMWRIGNKSVAALREPSLSLVSDIKGGVVGGDYARVVSHGEYQLTLYRGFTCR